MTNKLVFIINSLEVPKIKRILLYERKFLVRNYSCLQNPWLGGFRPQIPVFCPQLNLLNSPPPRTKFLCAQLFAVSSFHLTAYQNWHVRSIFHWRQLMAVNLFLNDFYLTNRCTHKPLCTPLFLKLFSVCRINFSRLDTFLRCHFSPSLSATQSVLLANYPRFSYVQSRTVWTSSSACRGSSALT